MGTNTAVQPHVGAGHDIGQGAIMRPGAHVMETIVLGTTDHE